MMYHVVHEDSPIYQVLLDQSIMISQFPLWDHEPFHTLDAAYRNCQKFPHLRIVRSYRIPCTEWYLLRVQKTPPST